MKIVQIQNTVFFTNEQMFDKIYIYFIKGNNINSNDIALQRSGNTNSNHFRGKGVSILCEHVSLISLVLSCKHMFQNEVQMLHCKGLPQF